MTHKFGIHLLKTVEEALEIDRTMNTDFWQKAINKEMSRVKIAWATHDGHTPQQVWGGKVAELIGFQEIGCHIVFDINWTSQGRLISLPAVILLQHQAH